MWEKRKKQPLQILLTWPPACIIFKFLVHNVWLKSHITTTPKLVTPLIWHIIKGWEIDVARIISRELKGVALSGLTHKFTNCPSPVSLWDWFVTRVCRFQDLLVRQLWAQLMTNIYGLLPLKWKGNLQDLSLTQNQRYPVRTHHSRSFPSSPGP